MQKCVVCGQVFIGTATKCCECKRESRNASRRINRNRYKRGECISKTIAEVREQEGLRPLQPGKIPCLRCDREFNSKDKITNRICNCCKGMTNHTGRAGGRTEKRIRL